jgi:hypothetical protein
MTQWTLTEVMAQALGLTPSAVEPEQTKFNQRLVDKLKYCKEVLVSIWSASVNGGGVVGAAGGEDDGTADVSMGAGLGDAVQTGSMGLNV